MTLDDCTNAEERAFTESGERTSMSKPHPFMLDRIAGRLGGVSGTFFCRRYAYMLAAGSSQAGFKGFIT